MSAMSSYEKETQKKVTTIVGLFTESKAPTKITCTGSTNYGFKIWRLFCEKFNQQFPQRVWDT